MINALAETIYEMAKVNEDIVVLIGDVGFDVFDKFRKEFPKRFYNMGLSEANMMTVACGLADKGFIPFVYGITPHVTMRPYEQLRNDVCYNNCNVKIIGVGAGLHYSNQGFTHQGLEDIAILNPLPNITIFSPCSPLEMKQVVKASIKMKNPVYIRMGRTNGEPFEKYYGETCHFEIGKGVLMENGKDASIIATGGCVQDALTASEKLKEEGIFTKVINISTIKPLDEELILETITNTEICLTVEEHNVVGGLGSCVADILFNKYCGAVRRGPHHFKKLGVAEYKTFCGTYQDLKEQYGIDVDSIVKTIKELKL